MRYFTTLLCLTALIGAMAADAQESSLVFHVTDVWREPIARAAVYAGTAPQPGMVPLSTSTQDGRCTIDTAPGQIVTVVQPRFAPLTIPIEQSDIERGYITAILYEGGAVQANFRVGSKPAESDYIVLQYADPMIYGGWFQQESQRTGSVRFSHVPEGLAYLTAGIGFGGAFRTTTLPVQVENESTNYMQLAISVGSAAIRGTVIGPDGSPVPATLSGTFIFDRRIEELRGQTDDDGNFALTFLPDAPLVFRASLEEGLLKRVDFDLTGGDELERDIRFDEGTSVDVVVKGAPRFDWIDVFLLDAAITADKIRDPTDRATYLRSARYARLESETAELTIPGVQPGQYTQLAVATRVENGRRIATISEFKSLTVGDGDLTSTIEFRTSE